MSSYECDLYFEDVEVISKPEQGQQLSGLNSLYLLPSPLSGNFCPLCDKCYDDDDYDSKMMECGRCNHWVHAKCENLTGQ